MNNLELRESKHKRLDKRFEFLRSVRNRDVEVKKDFTQTNETECIALLNKEITSLKEELEYYKESERALKNALRNMVSKVKTNS